MPWPLSVVQFARETGALVLLQFGLIFLVVPHLLAGELATAARLIEEDRLIAEATGNPPVAYTAMTLAAWRGQEAPATELIEATVQEATARGQGRLVNLGGLRQRGARQRPRPPRRRPRRRLAGIPARSAGVRALPRARAGRGGVQDR